ncbi:hypothetical protein CHUAL_007009 [Chamberlinius hualienensis]
MGILKMADKTSTQLSNPLEQYVLLAKGAKGAAVVELIKQVLEAPGVYVFGELLDMPSIQELAGGQYDNYLKLLNLFSYGTFSDYKENESELPPLTPNQVQKLKHLTIVSLATKIKCIPYTLLLKELDLKNLRELEDLIIEGIYADIIHGKLDQKNNQLEVDYVIGRDISSQDVSSMMSVLQEWSDCCETLLNNIETLIKKANSTKDTRNKHKAVLETEVIIPFLASLSKNDSTKIQNI